MVRFIMPVILIGISISVFFVFTSPLYEDLSLVRSQVAAYDGALNNSKALENERDKLTEKYNTISQENLAKLQKLLPENIDNIRLILEIERIALPYGMVLKDVKYDTTAKEVATPAGAIQTAGATRVAVSPPKDYGVWELEFSTSGTYNNFLNFTRDLENNLRIVDISSITFSSGVDTKLSTSFPEVYKYNFKIRTYWLKN